MGMHGVYESNLISLIYDSPQSIKCFPMVKLVWAFGLAGRPWLGILELPWIKRFVKRILQIFKHRHIFLTFIIYKFSNN